MSSTHRRTTATRSHALTSIVAALIAAVTCTVPAGAAPGTGTARPLAVSVPAEPAPLRPGATGTIPIGVVNPGTKALTVRITARGLLFGDDGHVTLAGVDPLWAGRVDFPPDPITIPRQSYRNVGLVVHMPPKIDPDLYFVGFLVTPIAGPGNGLTYINQIGSYVTIDVPGPRDRRLTADLHLPGFALTDALHAHLGIHNVGAAAAVYWGENDPKSTPGSGTQQRFDRSLLPRGRSRTVVLDVKPGFLVALVTMRVHIIYPGRTDATTSEIVITKRVLIVQPIALVILAAAIVGAGLWYWYRRRRRRAASRNGRPGGPRPDRSTAAAKRAAGPPARHEREATHVVRTLERLLDTRRAT